MEQAEGEKDSNKDESLGQCWQVPDMRPDGMWFVDTGAVNLEDLLKSGPGRIVRCNYLPAVQYVPLPVEHYNNIAGLISDAA